MRSTAITAIIVSMVLSVSVLGQPNLILNGDFESGNTDFTTDYIYIPPPLDDHSLWPEGVYSIDTDPHNGHANFWSFGDHTTGSGNMLIANGHPEADKRVWEQTVAVLPNAVYVLTYYLSSCVPGEPAVIECSINGISLGSAGAPTAPGTWTEVYYSWDSGTSTSATIALEDLNIVRGGNDFVIDDISLSCTKINVLIDIKPGSYPNSINPNANGVIPLAILTTDIFDAGTVDPQTVALEGVVAKAKGKSGKYGSWEDVDSDGDLDLVVQIPNTIDWAEGATEATLTGNLKAEYGGYPIEGTDSVNIVPPK
ncbi:MAG: hypothetical protein ACYTDV_20235 [Planctomycetota bacterium]|jgi:hypothetical protein